MPKKDRISPKDKALFRESVKGVRRMKSDTVEKEPSPKTPKKIKENTSTENHIQDKIDSLYNGTDETWQDEENRIQPEQHLSYAISGVDHKTSLKLKSAKFPIEATLDLHGMTAAEAKAALVEFITRHRCQYRRCVCIIHGKGQKSGRHGVLKSKINLWLPQLPEVIAFESAPPRHGGTGAVLVLIKRRKVS